MKTVNRKASESRTFSENVHNSDHDDAVWTFSEKVRDSLANQMQTYRTQVMLRAIRAHWSLRVALAVLALFTLIYLSSLQISSKPQPRVASLITEEHIGAVQHWTRKLFYKTSRPPDLELLVLVLNNDETSWGVANHGLAARTLGSFVELLQVTDYPPSSLSLGLLTSSKSEFARSKSVVSHIGYSTSQIIYHPGYGEPVGRSDRHAEGTQRERRRLIARLRNYLMFRTLRNEQHIIWLDADVHWLAPGIIQKMIQHSYGWQGNPPKKVGIITARCVQDDNTDYDLNAWVGPRLIPTPAQVADTKTLFVPQATAQTKFMEQLVSNTTDDNLVHLDSVGGTILYMAAESVRQGLTFPVYNTVGTQWNLTEGWDGIETEGVCYVAKSLGFGCFGLGGTWHVEHTLF